MTVLDDVRLALAFYRKGKALGDKARLPLAEALVEKLAEYVIEREEEGNLDLPW